VVAGYLTRRFSSLISRSASSRPAFQSINFLVHIFDRVHKTAECFIEVEISRIRMRVSINIAFQIVGEALFSQIEIIGSEVLRPHRFSFGVI